ncbi:MAG: class I SAM-dependent methyltransferase [Pirellulales bacterium]|nr:class I SAM-dependent methyltransferase [Pirellulales bacterium]
MAVESVNTNLHDLLTRSPLQERNGVLEYVVDDNDYCQNFGLQWNHYRDIQVDSLSGSNHSHHRFYAETGWDPRDLAGKLVLDAGCGAGRFAEIALEAGARVVAIDLSSAIGACQQTLSRFPRENYLLLRASLFELPLPQGIFDGVYSLGVLQHTPDPLLAIRRLAGLLKPGGELATWIYSRETRLGWHSLRMQYMLRKLVPRKWSLAAKLRAAKVLTTLGFPAGWTLSWFGRFGQRASNLLPYAARHHLARGSFRRQWDLCVLDTFDWIGPQYDLPQTEEDVRRAMMEAGLINIRRTPALGMAIVGQQPTGDRPR